MRMRLPKKTSDRLSTQSSVSQQLHVSVRACDVSPLQTSRGQESSHWLWICVCGGVCVFAHWRFNLESHTVVGVSIDSVIRFISVRHQEETEVLQFAGIFESYFIYYSATIHTHIYSHICIISRSLTHTHTETNKYFQISFVIDMLDVYICMSCIVGIKETGYVAVES